MIGRYPLLMIEPNNERNIPSAFAHFVHTSFRTIETCILAWQTELRVNPTVPFTLLTFASAMCVNWFVIEICTPPRSYSELNSVVKLIDKRLK